MSLAKLHYKYYKHISRFRDYTNLDRRKIAYFGDFFSVKQRKKYLANIIVYIIRCLWNVLWRFTTKWRLCRLTGELCGRQKVILQFSLCSRAHASGRDWNTDCFFLLYKEGIWFFEPLGTLLSEKIYLLNNSRVLQKYVQKLILSSAWWNTTCFSKHTWIE